MSFVVALTTVWLNDAVDPADVLRCGSAASLSRVTSVQGRAVQLAGGGFRMVQRRGRSRVWSLSMPRASRAEVDWLEAHLDRVVTARDHRGHKIHARFLSVPVEEFGAWTTAAGVELELVEVRHSEVV